MPTLEWRELQCTVCFNRLECGNYNFYCPFCKKERLVAEEQILKQEY